MRRHTFNQRQHRRSAGARPMPRRTPIILIAAAIATGCTAPAAAQGASMSPRVLGGGGGVVVIPRDALLDPASPEARAHAELQRHKRQLERELRLLQRSHFGRMRDTETRQIGLMALREHTEPAALILMTELFDREAEDVRGAILDHFATLASDEGDAALAWEAVHGEDAWYRERAGEHLARRVADRSDAIDRLDADANSNAQTDPVPPRVRGVLLEALRGEDDTAAVAAADLAAGLNLFEFIPAIAAAQVATRGGGGTDRTGDLGWIMIGQQTSFVADLVPVVSNNAVGLDPQIGVVSDGVMLRVHDAAVTVYRTEIYQRLVDWTTAAWGRPTRSLGYDAGAWNEWYTDEFVPHLERGDDEP